MVKGLWVSLSFNAGARFGGLIIAYHGVYLVHVTMALDILHRIITTVR
jgi:hypothetical protein